MLQNKNWKVLLLGAALGGVGFLCLCLALIAVLPDSTPETSQDDARATEVEGLVQATIAVRDAQIPVTAPTEPVPTAAPTSLPEPTRTAAPTYTPLVTSTPVSTATVSAIITEDADEKVYLRKIVEMSIGCQEGLYGIAEQSEKASNNSLVMFETQWKVDTATALLNIDKYCVGMRDIAPVPPRFATLHGYVEQMAGEMDQMVDNFTYGIDNMDADRLISASEHMSKGTEYVQKMSEEMDRLNGR